MLHTDTCTQILYSVVIWFPKKSEEVWGLQKYTVYCNMPRCRTTTHLLNFWSWSVCISEKAMSFWFLWLKFWKVFRQLSKGFSFFFPLSGPNKFLQLFQRLKAKYLMEIKIVWFNFWIRKNQIVRRNSHCLPKNLFWF